MNDQFITQKKNWVNPPSPSISPGMEPKGSTCITRRPDPDLRACKQQLDKTAQSKQVPSFCWKHQSFQVHTFSGEMGEGGKRLRRMRMRMKSGVGEGRRNRGEERKGGGRRTHDLMTTNPFNCSNLLVTLKVLGKLRNWSIHEQTCWDESLNDA